jgi:hypothetical protein
MDLDLRPVAGLLDGIALQRLGGARMYVEHEARGNVAQQVAVRTLRRCGLAALGLGRCGLH